VQAYGGGCGVCSYTFTESSVLDRVEFLYSRCAGVRVDVTAVIDD